MNDFLYKHVLFKDLKNYLKRTDYFDGYTDIEKSWIRKNLGIGDSGQELLQEYSYDNLSLLKEQNNLVPGKFYMIPYLIDYKIILMAYSSNDFLKLVIILCNNPNSLLWDVKYDFNDNRVIYLKDENLNIGNFDFKHIKINEAFTFSNEQGEENSSSCFANDIFFATNIHFIGNANNNIIRGSNVKIGVPINNLVGELNDIRIDKDEIGLTSDTIKQIVKYDNKQYIDYLDLETLTHLFYAIDTIY